MHPRPTWRELLLEMLADPLEYERLARAIGVPKITLMRWATGETREPRKYLLDQLLAAITSEALKQDLTRAIQQEFTDFSPPEGKQEPDPNPYIQRGKGAFQTSQEIPSLFYDRVVSALTTTPEPVRFWSLSQLILQQMLGQIDPQRTGLQVSLLRCTEPGSDGKVHSLREAIQIISAPWSSGSTEGITTQERILFFGIESIAGYAIQHGRPFIEPKADGNEFPLLDPEHERAAAAFPIMGIEGIAGCLTISSRQSDFFSQEHVVLIQKYVNLIALLFKDFYHPNTLELYAMPSQEIQRVHCASFRARVTRLMKESASQQAPLSHEQAIFRVRKELEEELFRLPGAVASPPPEPGDQQVPGTS